MSIVFADDDDIYTHIPSYAEWLKNNARFRPRKIFLKVVLDFVFSAIMLCFVYYGLKMMFRWAKLVDKQSQLEASTETSLHSVATISNECSMDSVASPPSYDRLFPKKKETTTKSSA